MWSTHVLSSREDLLFVLRCGGHNAGRFMSVILWVKVKTFVCQLASVQPEKHVMVSYVSMQVKFGMSYFWKMLIVKECLFQGYLRRVQRRPMHSYQIQKSTRKQ
jgi:hypothetical protein